MSYELTKYLQKYAPIQLFKMAIIAPPGVKRSLRDKSGQLLMLYCGQNDRNRKLLSSLTLHQLCYAIFDWLVFGVMY